MPQQLQLLQCREGQQNVLLLVLLPQQHRPLKTTLSLESGIV